MTSSVMGGDEREPSGPWLTSTLILACNGIVPYESRRFGEVSFRMSVVHSVTTPAAVECRECNVTASALA